MIPVISPDLATTMTPIQMINFRKINTPHEILSSEHSILGSPKHVPLKEVKKVREVTNIIDKYNQLKKQKSLGGLGSRAKH